MTMNRPSGDTKVLYEGKTVRSSAPSRKKLAGQAGAGSEIPKDAIPTVARWSSGSKNQIPST